MFVEFRLVPEWMNDTHVPLESQSQNAISRRDQHRPERYLAEPDSADDLIPPVSRSPASGVVLENCCHEEENGNCGVDRTEVGDEDVRQTIAHWFVERKNDQDEEVRRETQHG